MTYQDDVSQYVVNAAQKRGYSYMAILAILSALYQESGWSETIWDPTHTTYGVAQQDGSYPNRFNGYKAQVDGFLDRLDKQIAKPGASADIWLNICWLQQAPNWESAQYWVDNGRYAYLSEIESRENTVKPYLDKWWPNGATAPTQPQEPPATPEEEPEMAQSSRPSFNEFPIWSPSTQSRGGALPKVILLHTQEPKIVPPPNNAAEALGNYCANPDPEVSYHLYISQASDGGVTVVDGVDTDVASWSVGNANNESINYCFAGSSVDLTRAEWMKYYGNAIDVAAWYAVQDIKKYPSIEAKIIGFAGNYPGSHADDSGVADHKWVTTIFGWGDHKDVGPGFPADYFAERFAYWLAGGESQAPPPVVVPPKPPVVVPPEDPRVAMAKAFYDWTTRREANEAGLITTDRDLLEYLVLQIGTGHPEWPSSGRTVRDQLFYGDAP